MPYGLSLSRRNGERRTAICTNIRKRKGMNAIAIYLVLLFCCGSGCIIIGLLKSRRKTPPSLPPSSAHVICSVCHGGLSGLERYCPHCGYVLRYAVQSRPETTYLSPRKAEKRNRAMSSGRDYNHYL